VAHGDIPGAERQEREGKFLGRPTYLDLKRKGDKSMLEKQKSPEDA
jgi:hypothetical protein